jgi:hypothetical protein
MKRKLVIPHVDNKLLVRDGAFSPAEPVWARLRS